MKKTSKKKLELKKKAPESARKSSLHLLSEYFCSYLAALDVVNSVH